MGLPYRLTPPPRPLLYRIIPFPVTLVLVAVLGAIVATHDTDAAPAPSITLSRTSGTAGTSFTVTGANFAPNQLGELYFDGNAAGMPTYTTSGAGAFSVTARVPAVAPGVYLVTAAVAGQLASAAFTIPGAVAPPRKVVAYYQMWIGETGYKPDNIDFGAVTHVIHFCLMPRADGSVYAPNGWPFPNATLVNRVHARGAKVLLGLCEEFPAPTFSAMAASPTARAAFVANVAAAVTTNGYDGVDLDWEFPKSATDRDNLTALVGELRAALGAGRLLSMAVPLGPYWGQWYDFPAMIPYLDWIGAMTYGMHAASWSDHAGHSAPLFAPVGVFPLHPGGEASTDATRKYLLGRGVPAAKLIIGLPFYGERFDSAEQMGDPLTSTAGGMMDYRQIAPLINNGWTVARDPLGQVPYLRNNAGPGVISYDDATSIKAKCTYTINQGLGGVMIFSLGKDWSGAEQPLLRAARACR